MLPYWFSDVLFSTNRTATQARVRVRVRVGVRLRVRVRVGERGCEGARVRGCEGVGVVEGDVVVEG